MDSSETLLDLSVSFAFISPLLYFVLQPMTALKFSGGWRIAALAPLIIAVPVMAWCLFALAAESNLWPLPFIFFAPFGTIYLAGLIAVRYFKTGEIGI